MVGIVAHELASCRELDLSDVLAFLHGQGQSPPNIVDLMSILISYDHVEGGGRLH